MTTTLLDALAQVIGPDHLAAIRSTPAPRDPATYYDEDTLRRMHGLSRRAAFDQRRPKSFVPDSLGYLPNGSWTPGGAE